MIKVAKPRNNLIVVIVSLAVIMLACVLVPDKSYAASDLALDVTYGEVKCGQEAEFTLNASGGSGEYIYMFNAANLISNGNNHYLFDSSYAKNLKANPNTHNGSAYQDENTFKFTFYASGQYRLKFYVMSETAPGATTKTTAYKWVTINIDDKNYPTVEAKADAVAQECLESGADTDYEKALWLHDWLLQNIKYDYKYLYCSAEGGLCRGSGTCEAYHRAYEMLLDRVGVEHGRIEGNGHVWTAVKMDGKWYQTDVTWDDVDYASEKDMWQHLYFGLTDDLMKVAHSDHTSQTLYVSNSLENNYLVKSGVIKNYSDSYVNQAKNMINNGETSFELDVADNRADTVTKILYPIVAYQLKNECQEILTNGRSIDASYSDKKISCTITQPDRKLVTSTNSVTAYIGKENPVVTAYANDGSEVTFKLSNTKYANISVVDGRCTILPKRVGTAILTVTAPASNGFEVISKTVKITIRKALENNYGRHIKNIKVSPNIYVIGKPSFIKTKGCRTITIRTSNNESPVVTVKSSNNKYLVVRQTSKQKDAGMWTLKGVKSCSSSIDVTVKTSATASYKAKTITFKVKVRK